MAEVKAEDRVLCAVDGGQLIDDCALERSENGVTVRHADGGFRRFQLQVDGALATADGAEELTATQMGDGATDVRVGEDHYRFSAGQLR